MVRHTLSPGLLDNHLRHRIVAGVPGYDAPAAERDSRSQYSIIGIDTVRRAPLAIEFAGLINNSKPLTLRASSSGVMCEYTWVTTGLEWPKLDQSVRGSSLVRNGNS